MEILKVAIIIVNWNGREHLEICLRSVFNQTVKSFKVILVDNGSSDDSVTFVRQHFPEVDVITCPSNVGFAEGNNIGIRQALGDRDIKFIATLNNDTEVAPDWLARLIEVAEQDRKVGAVASLMMFFNERQVIDSAGDFLQPGTLKTITRGYRQKNAGQFTAAEECFSARAGAALYRREMLEEVCLGGDYFDRHYFAYVEDTDLSIRARLRGWKIVFAPRAIVYHKVAATTKKLSHRFWRFQTGRNRLFTAVKNLPMSLWPMAVRGRTSVDTEYTFSFVESCFIYIKIVFELLMALPRLLRQRRAIRASRRVSDEVIRGWAKRFAIR